jgi:hypothetical protein
MVTKNQISKTREGRVSKQGIDSSFPHNEFPGRETFRGIPERGKAIIIRGSQSSCRSR